MWTYSQSRGRITRDNDPASYPLCYSGKGDGKNNPQFQGVVDVGPIPQGRYTIGEPILKTPLHGPYVLPLTPATSNIMFGRAGFLMHSDSIVHPGEASEGCIVCPYSLRIEIWQSGDHDLTVVA